MGFFFQRKTLLVCLTGFLLAGCGVPMVSRVDWVPNKIGMYYPADVEGKDLMVQVRGTPFGGSEHDFAQAVTAMVTPPAWYRPPARIVSVSAYENNPSFRMVFLFGAPYTASGVQACAETPTLALAPSTTPLTVQGAVCKDNVMIAEAEGLLTQVDGPNDPALRRLISSMTNEMLTYQGFGLNSSSTDTFFRRSM